MEICDSNVAGVLNLQWQRESAFAAFLLGLQGINLPIRGVTQDHFISNMMLAGEFIHPSASGRVGNVQTCLSKCARSPDVDECAASAVRDPQAGILAVPSAIDI